MLRRKLNELARLDTDMLINKGAQYGDSWKRRGGVGAYMMLARKWDRIEETAKKNGYDIFKAIASDPELVDDIQDLGCYLWLVRAEGFTIDDMPSGNPYAKIGEGDGMAEALDELFESRNPWTDMATDHAVKKHLNCLGDSELVKDYYKIVWEDGTTERDKYPVVLNLRLHYASKLAGRMSPVELDATCRATPFVVQYYDADNDLTVRIPGRGKCPDQ